MESRALGFMILLFLRAVAWTFALSPPWARELMGKALGGILRFLDVRGRVARHNLEIAFPGTHPSDLAKRKIIFEASYRHLGSLILEALMLLGPMRRYLGKWVEFRGLEIWKSAKALGKPVFILSSHVGNWEVMAGSGALKGIDILIVTKRLKPAWFHRAVEAGRARVNVRGTYEPRTLRDVLAHAKYGGTVGFVLDQYSGPPVGVRVPFFGHHVGTSGALATLVRRTGGIVLPAVNYRTAQGRHVVEIRSPIEWIQDENPQREIALNTALYAKTIEEDVRAHPGEWLWTHRRFKGDLGELRPGEWEAGRARR